MTTVSTGTLTEFLLARITEDEAENQHLCHDCGAIDEIVDTRPEGGRHE